MADIQSAAAEIMRGKKEETTGQKYNGLPVTMGGHNMYTANDTMFLRMQVIL